MEIIHKLERIIISLCICGITRAASPFIRAPNCETSVRTSVAWMVEDFSFSRCWYWCKFSRKRKENVEGSQPLHTLRCNITLFIIRTDNVFNKKNNSCLQISFVFSISAGKKDARMGRGGSSNSEWFGWGWGVRDGDIIYRNADDSFLILSRSSFRPFARPYVHILHTSHFYVSFQDL